MQMQKQKQKAKQRNTKRNPKRCLCFILTPLSNAHLLFPHRNMNKLSLPPLFHSSSSKMALSKTPIFIALIVHFLAQNVVSQSTLCRKQCGDVPIKYPFGIDDGCGNPSFKNILVCTHNNTRLEFRTPSGTYPVTNISYSDPHLVISNPFMWNCINSNSFPPSRPFSLDSSTPFSLSPLNNFLFFNCSESVITRPRPSFCERNPELCDSECDSSSYLCRNLPDCPSVLGQSACCSYYPKATESLRLMLEECVSYTSVYWRFVGAAPPYSQVSGYGIRVDYDIPVTTLCFQCQDPKQGNGVCGYEAQSTKFVCLCDGGNSTSHCQEYAISRHRAALVAGAVASFSVSGVIIGGTLWYFKRFRRNKAVACGVQSNVNRLF